MVDEWLRKPAFCAFAEIPSGTVTLVTAHMTRVMGADFMARYVASQGNPHLSYSPAFAGVIKEIMRIEDPPRKYDDKWDNRIHQWAIEKNIPTQGAIAFGAKDQGKNMPLGAFSRDVGISISSIRNRAGNLRRSAIDAGMEPQDYIVMKRNLAYVTPLGQRVLRSKEAYEEELSRFEHAYEGWIAQSELSEHVRPFTLSRFEYKEITTKLGELLGEERLSTIATYNTASGANIYAPLFVALVKELCAIRRDDGFHSWDDTVQSWVVREKVKRKYGSYNEFSGLFDLPGSTLER